MREAFEAWARHHCYDLSRDVDGTYYWGATAGVWSAWEAGARWHMVQSEDAPANVRDAGSSFGGRKTDRSRT